MASDKEYKDKFKMMRSFLNYNIDLRKKLSVSDKRLITKYYNQFLELNNNIKTKVYRGKTKSHVKAVQQVFHEVKTLPKWKVAFVPYTSTEAPQITVDKNGKVKTTNKRSKLKRFYIPIPDMLAFITDTRNYVKELLEIHGVEPRQRLQVITGEHLSNEIFEAEILPEEMEDWVDRYQADQFIRGFVSPYSRA